MSIDRARTQLAACFTHGFKDLDLPIAADGMRAQSQREARSTWISCGRAAPTEPCPLFSFAYEFATLPVFCMHRSIASHKTFVKSAAQQTGQTGFRSKRGFPPTAEGSNHACAKIRFRRIAVRRCRCKTRAGGKPQKNVFGQHRQIAAAYVRLVRNRAQRNI